jgi:dipeptidyl aminopeptidase/acylaminoacyl peptidase
LALPLCADDFPYQKPSKEILDVLHAPALPALDANPSRTHVILLETSRYPSIADMAQPMLRLAGLRVDPKTFGPHMSREVVSMKLKRLSDLTEIPVAAPAGKLSRPRWSPDGKQFAFLNTTPQGIELWLAATETGKTRKIEGARINAVLSSDSMRGSSDALRWMNDSKTLLVRLVPAGRGPAPERPPAPTGPKVQESAGRAAGVWTMPDALQNAHDEKLFEYYATSQLAFVDTATGKITPVGKPDLYQTNSPSPDGQHLLVTRLHRPFSYLHYFNAFPKEVEVWNRAGAVEKQLASLPLEDRVPVDGVPVGPRSIQWRATENATLVWAEALDGGNPREKVPHRDRLLMLAAPFTGEPKEVFKTEHRYMMMASLEKGGLTWVTEFERNRRWTRTWLVNLNDPSQAPRELISRDSRDRYRDPGTPVQKMLPSGQMVLQTTGDTLLMTGTGASPKGDRPFLDRLTLADKKAERLFACDDTHYETVVEVLDDQGQRFITRRESSTEAPNYFLYTNGQRAALTSFADPTPQLRGIKKQLVTYKRPDGVPLSFTLYLPPNYTPGTRLPTVVWAYPLEYNDADTAGQVSGSTNRYPTMTGASHLFYLLAGYAILDNAAMPVVGSIEKVNDTYLEQVVASAKAAIDKAVELGVTDPNRVGVGGHSYGGFMTANLLAHSDLFRAGVARSGAYNRTLTPFGFQSERRTLWEAPETYLRMSPFLSAHKIKEPILLIHGEADNNMGTFPIQSERMYQAIRGNGGTIRYVVLPHEAHGYAARESVEHTIWEMVNWFDRHVKNAPPPAVTNNNN